MPITRSYAASGSYVTPGGSRGAVSSRNAGRRILARKLATNCCLVIRRPPIFRYSTQQRTTVSGSTISRSSATGFGGRTGRKASRFVPRAGGTAARPRSGGRPGGALVSGHGRPSPERYPLLDDGEADGVGPAPAVGIGDRRAVPAQLPAGKPGAASRPAREFPAHLLPRDGRARVRNVFCQASI